MKPNLIETTPEQHINSYEVLGEIMSTVALRAHRNGVVIVPATFSDTITAATTEAVDAAEAIRIESSNNHPHAHFFMSDKDSSYKKAMAVVSEEQAALLATGMYALERIYPQLRNLGEKCLATSVAFNKTYPQCSGSPWHTDGGIDVVVGIMPNEFAAEIAPSRRFWPWARNTRQSSVAHFPAAIVGMRGPGAHRVSSQAMYHRFWNPRTDTSRHSIVFAARVLF